MTTKKQQQQIQAGLATMKLSNYAVIVCLNVLLERKEREKTEGTKRVGGVRVINTKDL